METTGMACARFMNDWVILAPTRWKLRPAIRLVNETLAELKVGQHPDKTFIGRVCRGFDFLGYLFTSAGLEVAPRAVEHCVERVSRLYERGVDLSHIGAYVRRWQRWARSGASRGWAGIGVIARITSGIRDPARRGFGSARSAGCSTDWLPKQRESNHHSCTIRARQPSFPDSLLLVRRLPQARF